MPSPGALDRPALAPTQIRPPVPDWRPVIPSTNYPVRRLWVQRPAARRAQASTPPPRRAACLPRALQRVAHYVLRLRHDSFQVLRVAEAFRIHLVEVLGARDRKSTRLNS